MNDPLAICYVLLQVVFHILFFAWLASFVVMGVAGAVFRAKYVQSSDLGIFPAARAAVSKLRTIWCVALCVCVISFFLIGLVAAATGPLHLRYADKWGFGLWSPDSSGR